MYTLPITKPAKQQEWNIILAITKINGFLLHIIHKQRRNQQPKTKTPQHNYAKSQNAGNILLSLSTITKNN